jgi:hypothetical protein
MADLHGDAADDQGAGGAPGGSGYCSPNRPRSAVPAIVHYWRSFEQLDGFARDSDLLHLPA